VENSVYKIVLLPKPGRKVITVNFFGKNLPLQVTVFICTAEIIHQNKIFVAEVIEVTGEAAANKTRCAGYYDHNTFILREYKDIFRRVPAVLRVVGDKFFHKCAIFSL